MQPRDQASSTELSALIDQLEATLQAAASVSDALLDRLRALSDRVVGLQAAAGEVRLRTETLRAFERAEVAPEHQDAHEREVSSASSERPGPSWPQLRHPLGVLLVEVERSDGPLDLRAVDRPVSGHPEVADVALLDYDGRRARLKIWTRAAADAREVSEALDRGIRASLGAPDAGLRVQVRSSAA